MSGVRSRGALLGVLSIALYVTYAVFIYTIAPPIVAKPVVHCGVWCTRVDTGYVESLAVGPACVGIPLIVISMLANDETSDKASGAFVIFNIIMFALAYAGGFTFAKTPIIDYVLFVFAFITGVLYFTMRE